MSADPHTTPIALITIPGPTVPLLNTAGGTGNFTPAKIQLYTNGQSYVTQAAVNGTLVFTQAGNINYMFADATIRPIGIGFKRDGAAGRGDRNLPLAGMFYLTGGFTIPGGPGPVGAGLKVYDAYASSGAPGQYVWEYFIIFQDSSGTIGAIDPSDENDN